MKIDKTLAETWFKKNHKDIIESCWIGEDTKNMYKNLVCAAFEGGFKTAEKQYTKSKKVETEV